MPTQSKTLFLLEDLEDTSRTGELPEDDLEALRSVAEWITTYVARPHEDLVGHAGSVCPFVPGSLERKTLWLAAENIADRELSEVVELMSDYKQVLLDTPGAEADDVVYNVLVVVFTDLPSARAEEVFNEVLKELAVPSYVEHGILFGPYYEGNAATALYNPSFHPFESPVPFLFVRHGVVGDWKFFLDDDKWLELWARRSGEPGTQALAQELRRLPWRPAVDSDITTGDE